MELIKSIEAACLTDITYDNLNESIVLNDADEEMQKSFNVLTKKTPADDQHEQEENLITDDDVQLSEELFSDGELEDSLDRLVHKYDPESKRKRAPKKKLPPAQSDNPIKRSKKISNPIDVIDLSQSPPSSSSSASVVMHSPVSRTTSVIGGNRLRKFKTFNGLKNVAGPSYASSPISKFSDVETHVLKSPIPFDDNGDDDDDDEFDKLVAKYDFPSPIIPLVSVAAHKQKSPVKHKALAREPLIQKVKPITIQSVPEIDEEHDERFISVDDINPQDYEVILLVDIGETTG
jgi:hypothetical protein